MKNVALPLYRDALQTIVSIVGRVDEAELLLEASVFHAAGQETGARLSRLQLYMKMSEQLPSEAAWIKLQEWANLRKTGVPIQYLTGEQSFLDHTYCVGPGVLIPRPETELLLMTAWSYLKGLKGLKDPLLGFEIGLGSGVLSVELISKLPDLVMLASEVSEKARQYAVCNANRVLNSGDVSRLKILSVSNPLNVFEPFHGNDFADFIITNPPYLLETQFEGPEELEEQVRQYEPPEALFAPASDPLYFYRSIADNAYQFLKRGGFVFAEVPHERAKKVFSLFDSSHSSEFQWQAQLLNDLTGRERILVARLSS
jgi:release factor glutamine methyltransferase